MSRALIVPAAGSGSRLGSSRPKYLAPVLGRPMVSYLIELYREHVDLFVMVVHPSTRAEGEKELASLAPTVQFCEQRRRTGMLDAILIPRPSLESRRPLEIWVSWCDQIAIHPRTVQRLATPCDQDDPTELLFPTMRQRPPYIHLARADDGSIHEVLHRREGDAMPAVGESDMGLFRLSDRAYFELLPEFARLAAHGSGTGERNFLPFIPWLSRRGRVETFAGHHPIEAVGVNTREDLEQIERHLSDGR